MKELSIEEKAKAYDEAIIRGSRLWESDMITRENYEYIFPELKESKDERVRKEIITFLKEGKPYYCPDSAIRQKWAVWLEKQGEQKPMMIQWKGNNLKEIIDFTGKDKNFDKWFKSFAEYEKYVSEHDNVFKLFNADGSHFEIPVGAWIVKTPDGYNAASKAVFKQKPALSEEDEHRIKDIIYFLDTAKKHYASTVELDTCIDWLKSLKDRHIWKPSDEQINALHDAAVFVDMSMFPYPKGILMKLYKQLKKLREE